MEIKDKFFKLRDCYNKFKDNYFDRNFTIITENNKQVQFNFRQSGLCNFFGIDASRVDDTDEMASSYHSFTTLLRNKYDYINENRDDMFASWSNDVMNSYLSAPIFDGENMQFLVDTGDIVYIYINTFCEVENGKLLVLKFDGFKYYNPVTMRDINGRDDLLEIINSGKVEIISLLYLRTKDKTRFIESIKPSSKDKELFKDVSHFLYSLGLDNFNYSDKDIMNILFSSQFGRTQVYDSKELGVECDGRLKMNNNAYVALMKLLSDKETLNSEIERQKQEIFMYKNMLSQALEAYDYYKEIAENAIGELYDEKNKPKGLARILKKDKRS